ncbi:MAG: ribonuclease HI [bacterium]|nr:ribonuclease HI [bacterium]
MPKFDCTVCQAPFDVAQAALDKYPGWTPKFCREHSPRRSASGTKARARGSAALREENLTLKQVLAKYSSGPQTGVFTDGSASPNPGPGGWGAVWVEDGEVRAERHGKEKQTTNNRMELAALIEGYRLLPEDARTTLLTDSKLCVNTINDWADGWKRRGWKRKGGPIKNLELVQELYELDRAHPHCEIAWIAAHSGHLWNEYADSLATAWMRDDL